MREYVEVEKGLGTVLLLSSAQLWCGYVFWCVKLVFIFLRLTVTTAFMPQPYFSPYSCLGTQQHLHGKIPLGSYWIFFHPRFSLEDNLLHRIPAGHYSLPFPVSWYYHFCSLFIGSSGFILTASKNRQPSPAWTQRIIKMPIWKRHSIKHAFCSHVQRKYYS